MTEDCRFTFIFANGITITLLIMFFILDYDYIKIMIKIFLFDYDCNLIALSSLSASWICFYFKCIIYLYVIFVFYNYLWMKKIITEFIWRMFTVQRLCKLIFQIRIFATFNKFLLFTIYIFMNKENFSEIIFYLWQPTPRWFDFSFLPFRDILDIELRILLYFMEKEEKKNM